MARSDRFHSLGVALAALALSAALSACASDDPCPEPGDCTGQQQHADDGDGGPPVPHLCALLCSRLENECEWTFAPDELTGTSCLGMCAHFTDSERQCMNRLPCSENVDACLDRGSHPPVTP